MILSSVARTSRICLRSPPPKTLTPAPLPTTPSPSPGEGSLLGRSCCSSLQSLLSFMSLSCLSPSSPGEGGWEGTGEEGRGDEGLGRGSSQARLAPVGGGSGTRRAPLTGAVVAALNRPETPAFRHGEKRAWKS